MAIFENPRKSKRFRRTLLSLLLVLVLVAVAGVSYNFGNRHAERNEEVFPRLPLVTTHVPLPKTTPVTYDQTLAINTLPVGAGYQDSSCGNLPADWLQTENAKVSTDITMGQFGHSYTPWPEGSALWLDKTSVGCGATVGIHASLSPMFDGTTSKSPRVFEAIRIGWYGGAGGRVVWSSAPIKLKNLKTPVPKDATRMIQTSWPVTISVSTANWLPGFYLFVSKLPGGKFESSAPLIIRAPLSNSTLALVHSTMTWAAYNTFGGRSLYVGPGISKKQKYYERSRIVSMDRPLAGSGNELLFRDALPIVQLAEKENISLDQFADTDINASPAILSHFAGVVWSGHPEYWTQTLFNAAIAARNSGVNLAFFGANTAYWRANLLPSPHGKDREVEVYRTSREDPAKLPSQATLEFQDPIINESSSLIDGSITSAIGVFGDLKPVDVPSWLGIPKNSVLKGFSKFSEIASPKQGVQTPPDIHPLFRGKFTFAGNPQTEELRYANNSVAQMDWWQAPSGAVIFSAGVNLWVCNLLNSCGMATVDPATRDLMDTITTNVLTTWSKKVNAADLLK
ncbi:MAG: N,N-dimethylformamidase beta subunit family domain-containing protein [Actinomycetes bacterium]